jgi:Leucine-rich repeat (LRR) protein
MAMSNRLPDAKFVFPQKLLPKLEFVDLSHNSLTSLEHLHLLSRLRQVDVSFNSIRTLSMLHTRLGNITTLNLAGNKIEALDGLYSASYEVQVE